MTSVTREQRSPCWCAGAGDFRGIGHCRWPVTADAGVAGEVASARSIDSAPAVAYAISGTSPVPLVNGSSMRPAHNEPSMVR